MVYAASGNATFHVRVPSETTRTGAFGLVMDSTTFGAPSTHSRLEADVVTLLCDPVAGLVVFTLGILGTALDSLSTALVIWVSNKAAWAGALEATRKVRTYRTMATGSTAVEAFVDVLAFASYAHVSLATV